MGARLGGTAGHIDISHHPGYISAISRQALVGARLGGTAGLDVDEMATKNEMDTLRHDVSYIL